MARQRVNPAWLGRLTVRDEATRRSRGLWPGRDGWYKTIAGRKRYICKPMPLAAAVGVLDARIDDIRQEAVDRPVQLAAQATTLESLCEVFLSHLWLRHTTGVPRKLSRRTYDDYLDVLGRFCDVVGPHELAMTAGPAWFSAFARQNSSRAATSRRRDFIYISHFFNWAGPGRHGLNFYRRAVNFGPDFVKPSEDDIRGSLSGDESVVTPAAFGAAMKAVRDCPMLRLAGLLGLNCGYIPGDLVALPLSSIDLDAALIRFPRVKTTIPRINPLMPETLAALRAWLKVRPTPKPGSEDLLFLRENGDAFGQRRAADDPDRMVSHQNAIAVYWRQVTGVAFKRLRTSLATAMAGHPDDSAIDLILGHAATSIRDKFYVKQFDPERCRRAVEHAWPRYAGSIPPAGPGRLAAAALAAKAVSAAAATRPAKPGRSGSAAGSSRAHARRGNAVLRLASAE